VALIGYVKSGGGVADDSVIAADAKFGVARFGYARFRDAYRSDGSWTDTFWCE
jgi:hypothetical protein